MLSTRSFLFLVFVISCVFVASGQKSKKFFRNDYQYIGSNDAFYKIHTVTKSWEDAKEKCASEGALLFYPNDDDEAYSIISFWNETQPFREIHLGISSPHAKGIFESVDGVPISSIYNKWGPGEPNDEYGREDCVVMYKDGNLNDVPCHLSNPFICKKTLASLEWNDRCNIPDLEYVYSEKLESCYKFHLKPMNWAEAYAQCHTEQSHLAIINSKDEADYLAELTKNAEKDEVPGDYLRGAVHLGFQENGGKWTTIIKNTPLSKTGYKTWGAHQPDGRGQEKCGSMFYNGKLNDIDCNERMFFICEHNVDQ